MIRVVIADDEPLSRRLVNQLLERHADVVVVAECADGAAAREAIATCAPAAMIPAPALDWSMAGPAAVSSSAVARRRAGFVPSALLTGVAGRS